MSKEKVIEVLRRDVVRPDKYERIPTDCVGGDGEEDNVAWRFVVYGEGGGKRECCPMGLHPLATKGAPIEWKDMPVEGVDDKDITDFYNWWDELTDVEEAMEVIWGHVST